MKQVIAGLLFASSLTMSQGPPPAATSTATPVQSAAPLPVASSTAAPVDPVVIASTTSAPVQPVTTAAAAATAAATTAAPVPPVVAATTSTPVQVNTQPPPPPVTTQPPMTTTAAPINPYCPAGTVLNVLGPRSNPMMPAGYALSQNAQCRSNIPGHPESRAVDFEGMLTCNNYACCLCQEIWCGGSGWPCDNLKIGDSGAVGVQNILVTGTSSIGSWTGLGFSSGAQVDCAGLESCKRSKIRGKAVGQFQCSGDYGCESADILYEATEGSNFQCNGLFGCANFNLEIVIPADVMEIGTIEFNGQQAAQGATVTIRALGASVQVRNLECMNPTACINTQFKVIGNVFFESCDLQGMQNLHSLPAIIQSCAMGQAGQFMPQTLPFGQQPNFPQFPQTQPQPPIYQPPAPPAQPQFPAYPQFPAPLPPLNQQTVPVTPATPAAPVTPSLPTNPVPATPATPATPSTPLPPLQSMSSASLKCLTNECANRQVLVQASNNFVFECLGSCQKMDLTVNVGYDPITMGVVERIDSLKFIRPNSGNGATIRINTQGMLIEVNDIRCEGLGSCRNMHLIVDSGVDLWNMNFDCNTPADCAGCKVTQSGGQPMDCFLLNGNNNGMFGAGQFLPATPGFPANPQQPAYPMPPQQPQQPGFPGYVYPVWGQFV